MSAAKIDAVEKLERLAEQARLAGQVPAHEALSAGVKLLAARLAHLDEQETLRDRMAMTIIQGVMAGQSLRCFGLHPSNYDTPAKVAQTAYRIADYMLEARKV